MHAGIFYKTKNHDDRGLMFAKSTGDGIRLPRAYGWRD